MGQLTKDFDQVLVSEGVDSIPAYNAGDGLVFLVPLSEDSAYPLYQPSRFYNYGPFSYLSGSYPGDQAILDLLPPGAVLQLVYGSVTSLMILVGGNPVYINFNPPLPTGTITVYGYIIPSYPIDPRTFSNEGFQSWARPLVISGYQAVPYFATAVEFPDEVTAPNGYPLVDHDGPITGVFQIPSPTGLREVSCEYWRDAPNRNWRPRGAPTIDGLYFSTYMGAMLFRGAFSRPRVPSVPSIFRQDPNVGWNAGATSSEYLDGNLHVAFQSSILTGGAVGLMDSARAEDLVNAGEAPQPADLRFGWYFDTDGNRNPRARIIENGLIVYTFGNYTPGEDGTTFEIRRVRSQVSYWTQEGSDPAEREYVSYEKETAGELAVGAALYAGGDTIP